MVKQGVSRTLYFVLGLLAIFAVSRCNVAEYSWERNPEIMAQKRTVYTKEIAADEFNSFTRLWPEFSKLGLSRGVELSDNTDNIANKLNWKARLWFLYHRWDAGRFFYVHERIEYILQALEIQREATKIIEMVTGRKDELAKETIKIQKQRINAFSVSDSEKLMVSSNEDNLRQLFKQYP